jgi:hypothetical protein
VDFILQTPWYEYDFWEKAVGLWTDTSLVGDDMIRKWERKYALTTEYVVKAAYGWLIKLGTKTAYEAPITSTAVVVTGLDDIPPSLTEAEDITRFDDGETLLSLPRYDAFKDYALALAQAGADFTEIAGNNGIILVSVTKPANLELKAGGAALLLEQPILTKPGREREIREVQISNLAEFLRALDLSQVTIEHVYDY